MIILNIFNSFTKICSQFRAQCLLFIDKIYTKTDATLTIDQLKIFFKDIYFLNNQQVI